MTHAELERAVGALLRDPAIERLAAARAALLPPLADSGPAKALDAEISRRRGELARAIALFREAIAASPNLHGAYHAAALAHAALRETAEARGLWTALLERAPDDATARFQIGLSFDDEGNPAEAARWYVAQLAHDPGSFPAAHNLGLARLALHDAQGAAAVLMRATALRPSHDGARAALVRAGRALGEAAELPAAVAALKRAIELAPREVAPRWALAAHQSSLALHDDALSRQREAHALDPADWRGESALLLEMHYVADRVDRRAMAGAHRAWAARHTDRLARGALPRRRPPGRQLRVGYYSPRFGDGPLASLFLPVLAARDPTRVRVALYAGHVLDDARAARMRSASDAWRILPDDDDAAAAMIAADDLDILVDLAGHSPGHRLPVFARKPAPVQATWLDYFNTTGVPEIDYLLTDRVHTPETDAAFVSERIVWLPNCRFAYAPVAAHEPSPPPQDRNGHVTFGSFNRHAKVTDDVAALWKSVLHAVPGSRLALRASAYRGSGTVAFVRERWARAGLPVERIDFLPYVPLADAMRAYRDIDVALDTFPYGGGVTTCDALAAGVPVVTLAGDAMVARQGAALLRAAGQPQWIAQTPADYVQLAVTIADNARRAGVRRDLALGLPASPLGGVAAFAAALERALRAMVEAGPRDGDKNRTPLVIEA